MSDETEINSTKADLTMWEAADTDIATDTGGAAFQHAPREGADNEEWPQGL